MASNDTPSPLGCDEARPRLADYVSGRLDGQSFAAMQGHVEACAACRRALSDLLADEEDRSGRRQRSRFGRRPGTLSSGYRRRPASLFWLLGLAAIAGFLLLRQPGEIADTAAARLASAPVHDLRDFLASERAPDLETTAPQAAKDWLARRVSYDVPAPHAAAGPARLLGTRLARLLERDVPVVLYEASGRTLALYLFEAAALPPIEAEDGALLVREDTSEGGVAGFTEILWRRGPLVYVLAAEMPADDLVPLAERLASEP
jgi:anti-sigma factor RsiW